MKKIKWFIFLLLSFLSNWGSAQDYPFKKDSTLPKLSENNKVRLKFLLQRVDKTYDDSVGMLITTIHGYQYHTDASEGNYHIIRESLVYALRLLDLEDKSLIERASKIIRKCLSLQDTLTTSKTRGIWGYYLEEPLATKKTPPDFNMADFNSDNLIDIWLQHRHKLTPELQSQIKRSLELAAMSIQKRNVELGYTNIAIKGTYVSYMVSHLFNLPEVKEYSEKKLDDFFAFTIQRQGFPEYNSPTYTPEAIRDLNKMQMHITDPKFTWKIDSIYNMAWSIIARHWFAPSQQLAGPHSRSYSSLLNSNFLHNLMSDSANDNWADYMRYQHKLPAYILHYFKNPTLPRTETMVVEPLEPQITCTTYMCKNFTLGTANRSSLWNQRRPCIAYWGTPKKPHYFQLRFLNNGYDFSSASFYSTQKENSFLAGINLNTEGGNKHISLDKIKNGQFSTSDVRIRFEFGNCLSPDKINLPSGDNTSLSFNMEGMPFYINLYLESSGLGKGYWETGHDNKNTWIDFVVMHGDNKTVDLNKLENAFWGIACSIGETANTAEKVIYRLENNHNVSANWKGMQLSSTQKVLPLPKHL